MKTYNVAVVGATGAVGQTMLSILEERSFPIANIYPLASARSAGKKITFNQKEVTIEDLDKFDFSQVDIALFSAGGSISEKYAPIAAEKGAVVVDNTSHFRYDDDIPLVVTEVNPEAIANYKARGIIANPNCSTIQMLVALKPLHDAATIKRINVATYQAVSGSGAAAIAELTSQTTAISNNDAFSPEVYPKQIAFNVLPHIDVFLDNDYTKEEMKMVWETQKIFATKEITVNPTAVRVPVIYGHSEAVNIETEKKLTKAETLNLLNNAEGVIVLDDPKTITYPTPAIDAAGNDAVFVGRIREDISIKNGINLWIVSDNIRKGAALNSVQIAEILIKTYI